MEWDLATGQTPNPVKISLVAIPAPADQALKGKIARWTTTSVKIATKHIRIIAT